MTPEITIIYFSDKYSFGYCLEDKKWYYLQDGNQYTLIREVHLGQIKYRKKGESKRVSHHQLIESSKKTNFKFEDKFCPF